MDYFNPLNKKESQTMNEKEILNKIKKKETNEKMVNFKNLQSSKIISKSSKNIFIDYQSHRGTCLKRSNLMLKEIENEDYDYEYLNPVTDYGSYLKERNENNISQRETFCSGFFITSFPSKNASILDKSEPFPASCNHKFCSSLKSMRPEIIMRYPFEDTDDLEINNLAATLCFPSGIKLCHCESGNKPGKMNDYFTLLTNRKGDRLYIMTYHFYLKLDKKELDKNYEKYPLKIRLKELDDKIKVINYDQIDDTIIKLYEQLKICKEFENRTYCYIPYCLALISKYPYVEQMEKSINCIFNMIKRQIKDKNLELNELLMYLIHSIPIPTINTKIQFPLPYLDRDEKLNKENKFVILDPPKLKDMNILNCNISELLKIFRIKNIIRIFRLLLFEKKIVFIDDDYSRLSNVMNSFISLLYPFQWVNVYIPILTVPMIKYLGTFLPFLVGVHSSFIPHIKKILTDNCNEKEQIYLIFIQEDKIRIGDFFKENHSKKINKTTFLHKNLINLPTWLYCTLLQLLLSIQLKMKNIKKEEIPHFNFEIQNAFVEIFVEMFSDYNKYIFKVGDEVIFNKYLFLSKKGVFEKNFLTEFLETQMFLQFKQDILGEGFEYFKSKVSKRNTDYYKEKLQQNSLINIRTFSNDEYNQKMRIYVIKSKFKNLIKEEENKINNINTKDNYIITYLNNIRNEKYEISNCLIYLLPNEMENLKKQEIDNKTSKKQSKKKTKKTNEEKIKDFHIFKIEDQIKEYIFTIFKSDINKKEDEFKAILKILTDEQKGREYFIKLISQNLSKIVILSKNSFDVLYNLINETLIIYLIKIETSHNAYKSISLLIKSTMTYGKEEKNKIITIWDICKKSLKENSLIYDLKFWIEWYNLNINNVMNLKNMNINDIKNKVIINISKMMKELEIDKTVIKYFTDNLMKNYFNNDLNLIQKTQKDISEYTN